MNDTVGKTMRNSIFLFTKDLRLNDNTGLIETLKISDRVILCYIMDSFVFNEREYKYFNQNQTNFVVESLIDLNGQIKKINRKSRLYVLWGTPHKTVLNLIDYFNGRGDPIDMVAMTMSHNFDDNYECDKIMNVCNVLRKIKFKLYDDHLLHDYNLIMNNNNRELYRSFDKYYRSVCRLKVTPVTPFDDKLFGPRLFTGRIVTNKLDVLNMTGKKAFNNVYDQKRSRMIQLHGGRLAALKTIESLKKRDVVKGVTCSRLSPHITMGTLSVREIHSMFKQFKNSTGLLRGLYMREFFMSYTEYKGVLYHYKSMIPEFDKIRFSVKEKMFDRWKNGGTGFPIIDAAMRKLVLTGYVSNTLRLALAIFLVKTLHIDQKYGAKYFSKITIDHDPALNLSNWQYVFGSHIYSLPLDTHVDPWKLGRDMDPDATFIKRFIPSLKDVPVEDIHQWDKSYKKHKDVRYPKPFVNLKTQRDKIERIYGDILRDINRGKKKNTSMQYSEKGKRKKRRNKKNVRFLIGITTATPDGGYNTFGDTVKRRRTSIIRTRKIKERPGTPHPDTFEN